MIRADGLGYRYGRDGEALASLSFTVSPGALCGLVGANGSGKSTLLGLLAGLFSPTTGTLAVGGARSPGAEDGIRRLAALVLQDPDQQIIGSTVREDLLLGMEGRADPARAQAAFALAARLGIRDLDARVETLSLGTRRKLCIATALRDGPSVLLLDEPFAGLDDPALRELRAILAANRAAGVTQVIAAHDLDAFADLADSWIVLAGGRVARRGTGDEVFPGLRALGVRPPWRWMAARGLGPEDG